MTPDNLEVEITYKIPEAIGELSGSGDALRCYLHQFSCLADKTIQARKEWETWIVWLIFIKYISDKWSLLEDIGFHLSDNNKTWTASCN